MVQFLVMPGHSSLPCADCVHLSALPGIHVFLSGLGRVDGRVKPGHDGQGEFHLLLPSIGVILSFASSMPSMQLTLSAITGVPSPLLPRANTSTPQSLQDW